MTPPKPVFFDIASQLDPDHPLLALSKAIDWSGLEKSFSLLYSTKGRGAKPIRLMSGLLMLKQLYNLSDESVIGQWQMNPYYQVFCGETFFSNPAPLSQYRAGQVSPTHR